MNNSVKMAAYEPVIREVLDSGGEFSIRPHGTSMLPMLSDGGDTVILRKKSPEVGDVVFYKRDSGEYVMHRLIKKRKDGYMMRGDNQIMNEYGVRDDNIIAVIIAFVKDGKRTEVTDEEYLKYVNTLNGIYRKRKIDGLIKKAAYCVFPFLKKEENDDN